MKLIRRFNKAICLILAVSFCALFESCTSSSNAASDDPNSGSIGGTWTLKSIQCLSVPSDNFPCWKSFIVPLSEINMQSNSTSVLTLSADGTYSGDMLPKITTLPQNIFGCELGVNPTKQHVDGTYSAVEGLIIVHVVNYLVNGQKQDSHDDAVVMDGTYTVSSSALTFAFNLAGGERWKVNFIK
jgi:hypothetical protein